MSKKNKPYPPSERYIVGGAEHTCCFSAGVYDSHRKLATSFEIVCDCENEELAKSIAEFLNEEERHLKMVRSDMPPTTPPFRIREDYLKDSHNKD